MSFRDRLTERGSFRGAEFVCEKHDADIGRRTVLKEYPGRDRPRVEDLGKATRKFSLEMFVIGEEYDADRDALREAFETAGKGTLIHPWWGEMTVTVDGPARATETTKEGGMCRFTARFIEAGDDLDLIEKINTAESVLSSVSALRAAVSAQFAGLFSVIHAVAAVVQSAIETIQEVASTVDAVRGKIAAALLVVDEAKAAINSVVEGVSALILTPVTLATSISSMISTVVDGVTSIGEAFNTVAEFFDGEQELPAEGNVLAQRARVDALDHTITGLRSVDDTLPAVPEGSAQQHALQRTNQEALVRLVKAESIASVCTTAVALTYESYDQAQATRQAITDFIDELLVDPDLGDEVYGPLYDLRAAITDHFNQAANTLPELVDFTPRVTAPALVLAYQIYGDATREVELLARNPSVRDPSAVQAGQTLRVLVNE